MDSEAVCYELDADASKLVASFEKGLRTMIKAAGASDKLEKAEDKLQKTTDKVGESAKKAELNLADLAGGIGVLSPALGGVVQMADEMKQGIGAATAVLGPWGMAAAAVATSMLAGAAAVAGVTAAAFGMTSQAVEAAGRLDEMGLSAMIPDDARTSLVEYTAAQRELWIAVDEIVVLLGAELAPTLTDIVTATRGLIAITKEWGGTIYDVGDTLGAFLDQHSSTFLVLSMGWDAAKEKVNQYAQSVEDTPNLGKLLLGDEDVPGTLKEIVEAEKLREKAAKDAASAAKARASAELAALREIDAANRESAAASTAETAQLNAQRERWMGEKQAQDRAMLAEEESARKDRMSAAAAEASKLVAAEKKKQAQMKAGLEQFTVGTLTALTDIAAASAENRMAEADADLERSQSREQALQDRLRGGKEMTEAERDRIEQELKDERQLQKNIAAERKKAANEQKRVAIIQALIGASQAIIQCFAQLGPIFGLAASIPVGIATGAEIATISKQQFHDGGSLGHGVDEFPMGNGRTGRGGEEAFVFNQRARENGAVERALQENKGSPAMGGGGGGTFVLGDAGRVIGEALVRETRRPGSPFVAGRGDGTRSPFRGRR